MLHMLCITTHPIYFFSYDVTHAQFVFLTFYEIIGLLALKSIRNVVTHKISWNVNVTDRENLIFDLSFLHNIIRMITPGFYLI